MKDQLRTPSALAPLKDPCTKYTKGSME